jgi:hypothetical protein
MKTRITSLILVLMTLLLTQSLFGQDNEIINPKFGLGVSLFNLSGAESETLEYGNSIYFTINIGSKFRLEPTVGYISEIGDEAKYSIEIGGFGRKSISNFNILYGLRIGLMFRSRLTNYYSPYIEEAKIIAPTLGGEYYFIKNFSIGSEVQLKFKLEDEYRSVYTKSSVIVRFYF